MLNEINIIIDEPQCMPVREHEEDAGLDLRTKEPIVVPAHGSVSIDTGVHLEIPKGYYGRLESKSGLNIKNSVVSLGGTIDAGYTGSIVAKLYNLSDEDYKFDAGDKIVQIVIIPCETPKLNLVEHFAETERGSSGFGSTGK